LDCLLIFLFKRNLEVSKLFKSGQKIEVTYPSK
jgi:hypothetical protein